MKHSQEMCVCARMCPGACSEKTHRNPVGNISTNKISNIEDKETDKGRKVSICNGVCVYMYVSW